jgi:hypothetical protein
VIQIDGGPLPLPRRRLPVVAPEVAAKIRAQHAAGAQAKQW